MPSKWPGFGNGPRIFSRILCIGLGPRISRCGDGTRAVINERNVFSITQHSTNDIQLMSRNMEMILFVRCSLFGTFIVSWPKCGDGVCERRSLDVDLKHQMKLSVEDWPEFKVQPPKKIKTKMISWKLQYHTSFGMHANKWPTHDVSGMHIRCHVEIRPALGIWNSTSTLKMTHSWPHRIDAGYWPWSAWFPWLFDGCGHDGCRRHPIRSDDCTSGWQSPVAHWPHVILRYSLPRLLLCRTNNN